MIASLPALVSRLRLKQLRLLIALDEQGSLHKAAEQVAITQPGATKALNEIEAAFGMRLFNRTSQGLEANDLGRCAIRYARLIHTDLAHLREEMIGILQGQGGRISVGAVMGAVPLLARSLERLRETQPELSVEVVEDTSARLLALIDQGRLDLAVCRTSVSPRPDAYEAQVLYGEILRVMANPAHPLAGAESQTPAELAAQTGTAERYIREWLNANAAGGYVTYHADTGRYSLSPEQALVLADESSPVFFQGGFQTALAAMKIEPVMHTRSSGPVRPATAAGTSANSGQTVTG